MPKEGKTITAANLAVAIARRGSNVILADFDFRKPGVAETFGLPEDAPGAIHVMSRQVPARSVSLVGDAGGLAAGPRERRERSADPPRTGGIRAPQSNGSLRVLPAGGATRSAPQQAQLQYLLTMLRADADLVILDTPPALVTVEVAELSRLIDVVLLIVRQGRGLAAQPPLPAAADANLAFGDRRRGDDRCADRGQSTADYGKAY